MSRRMVLGQTALGLGLFLVATLCQGYDLNWDVLNYHFYNGYAIAAGQIWQNIQVSMRQSYFCPILDIPFYFLTTKLPPIGVALALATFQSILYVVLFALAHSFFAPLFRPKWVAISFSTAVSVVGILSPVNILEVGGAYGDNTSAVPILAAVLILARGIDHPSARRRVWAASAAGTLIGLAVASKLTNAPFAVGFGGAMGVATAWHAARQRSIATLGPMLAGCATLSGALALGYGWWGILLYHHFQNPFFPSFNQIFRSSYAAISAYTDPAFALPTLRDKLLFTFVKNPVVTQAPFAGLFDVRMPVTLVLAAVGLSAFAVRGRRASDEARVLPALALCAFFLLSYVAWLAVLAINRYLVALELLAPLVCAVCVALIVPRAAVLWTAVALCAAMFLGSAMITPQLMWRPSEHRTSNTGGYFGVSAQFPAVMAKQPTLIAITGDDPVAFVIPFFPAGTRFVRLDGSLFYEMPGFGALLQGGDARLRRQVFGNSMGQAVCRRIAEQSGPIYVLRTRNVAGPVERAALRYYGLSIDPTRCERVASKAAFPISLCPAQRDPQPECG